jgi:hypothetical protein
LPQVVARLFGIERLRAEGADQLRRRRGSGSRRIVTSSSNSNASGVRTIWSRVHNAWTESRLSGFLLVWRSAFWIPRRSRGREAHPSRTPAAGAQVLRMALLRIREEQDKPERGAFEDTGGGGGGLGLAQKLSGGCCRRERVVQPTGHAISSSVQKILFVPTA